MKILHVKGNPIKLAIPLTEKVRTLVNGIETETEQDFYPVGEVIVIMKSSNISKSYIADVEGNIVKIRCDDLSFGVWSMEILCKDSYGDERRFFERSVVNIVSATKDAGIEAGVEFDVETHTIGGTVFLYAKGDKGDHGDLVLGIDHDKAFDGYFGNKLNNVLWSKDYQNTVNGDAAFQSGVYTNITRGVPNWLDGGERKWAPADRYVFFVVSGYNKDEDRYHINQIAFAVDKAQDSRIYFRHIVWNSLYTWEGNPEPTFDEWVFLSDVPNVSTGAEVINLNGEQGSFSLPSETCDRILFEIQRGKIFYGRYTMYGTVGYAPIVVEGTPYGEKFFVRTYEISRT